MVVPVVCSTNLNSGVPVQKKEGSSLSLFLMQVLLSARIFWPEPKAEHASEDLFVHKNVVIFAYSVTESQLQSCYVKPYIYLYLMAY